MSRAFRRPSVGAGEDGRERAHRQYAFASRDAAVVRRLIGRWDITELADLPARCRGGRGVRNGHLPGAACGNADPASPCDHLPCCVANALHRIGAPSWPHRGMQLALAQR